MDLSLRLNKLSASEAERTPSPVVEPGAAGGSGPPAATHDVKQGETLTSIGTGNPPSACMHTRS
jgi:hypothetical protein